MCSKLFLKRLINFKTVANVWRLLKFDRLWSVCKRFIFQTLFFWRFQFFPATNFIWDQKNKKAQKAYVSRLQLQRLKKKSHQKIAAKVKIQFEFEPLKISWWILINIQEVFLAICIMENFSISRWLVFVIIISFFSAQINMIKWGRRRR